MSGTPGVATLAGDCNGDGFVDMALIGTTAGVPLTAIPIALSTPFGLGDMSAWNTAVGGIPGVASRYVNPFLAAAPVMVSLRDIGFAYASELS